MQSHRRFVLAATLLLGAACASAAPVEILREVPAKGALRNGDVVYVDDGKCPAGEVKKITAGLQQTGKGRQVECVKRPDNH